MNVHIQLISVTYLLNTSNVSKESIILHFILFPNRFLYIILISFFISFFDLLLNTYENVTHNLQMVWVRCSENIAVFHQRMGVPNISQFIYFDITVLLIINYIDTSVFPSSVCIGYIY